MVKTNFLGDEIRKGNVHYPCIAYITIDLTVWLLNYPQAYLGECKYKIKKIKMSKLYTIRIRIRIRVRIRYWVRAEVRVRIWLWVIFLLIVVLCFKKCIDGCFLDGCVLTLRKSKKLVVILLTLNKPENWWSFYFPWASQKISSFLAHKNFFLWIHEFLQKKKKFIGSILDNN